MGLTGLLGSLVGRFVKPFLGYIAAALAALALAAAGVAWWQIDRAASLAATLVTTRKDLAASEAQVAAYEEAARIRQADDARRAEIDATATERDHALQSDPGGDAPLSDYLAGAARRLWP
ncbi:hypothetical protein [Acidimangrovimonas sediminis]|uniref:hypothetical protein n=1 Tax=Acidimangrovimonas sediminis TaxID=2056283 RepID=UPI000C80912E|nr:hypothetical protein [Acidimangrovimonas sediminis]